MLFKKAKLEKQLMEEIKSLAGVNEFPYEDAASISNMLTNYNRNNILGVMANFSTLEKYPNLYDNWDELMLKYKRLGLFPNWDVKL